MSDFMTAISNSNYERAKSYIDAVDARALNELREKSELPYYRGITLKNNPLLLATAKGWNHVDRSPVTDLEILDPEDIVERIGGFAEEILSDGVPEELKENPFLGRFLESWSHYKEIPHEPDKMEVDTKPIKEAMKAMKAYEVHIGNRKQKLILTALLARPDLDVNVRQGIRGFTPLHYACLRGDDPEFIKELLDRGAKTDLRDSEGRTPLDLMSLDYEDVQDIILADTCLDVFMKGKSHRRRDEFLDREIHWLFGEGEFEGQCKTATLPTRAERLANIEKIKEMLN